MARGALVDGASAAFAGLHARFAVGVNALPFDIPAEIESIWEVRA
jgi:enamine deaminase RidA (YjgF/YER057c/UK114 family)